MKTETFINIAGQKVTKIQLPNTFDIFKSVAKIDQTNFFECTFCNFKSVDNVDFVADYVSESGSQYMYTKDGVHRKSDHWNYHVSTCVWLIDGEVSEKNLIGFAKWSDFKAFYNTKAENIETKRDALNTKEAIVYNILSGEYEWLHAMKINGNYDHFTEYFVNSILSLEPEYDLSEQEYA